MTLATRTATDTLQQTLPWGTHERLVFGRALLRSTGFPAEGLALLDSDDILPLLDSFLAGDIDRTHFEKEYTSREESGARALINVLKDDAVSRAIAWQNPTAWRSFESL